MNGLFLQRRQAFKNGQTYMKFIRLSVVSVITFLLVSGCAAESWYVATRASAESECRKQPPTAADECLSRVYNKTYQQYEKERTRVN